MKRTNKNLALLITIFSASLLTSNIISSNGMIYSGIFLGDIELSAPAAVLAYAITFLCTDIIGQIWGKKEAAFAVKCGFISQILCTALIALTPLIFAPWFEGGEVYSALSSLGWFTLGSLAAYCCSQSWDVFIFHRVKNWAENKFSEKANRHRWLWNNASTMTSQLIDTAIFIGIGFGIGLRFSGLSLLGIMIGQYLIKLILAVIDTPFFYLFTRKQND